MCNELVMMLVAFAHACSMPTARPMIHAILYTPCAACMQNKYYAADAVSVDPMDKSITCVELDGRTFDVQYDLLAIATGSQGRLLPAPPYLLNCCMHAHPGHPLLALQPCFCANFMKSTCNLHALYMGFCHHA